jgi:hypothetical protein
VFVCVNRSGPDKQGPPGGTDLKTRELTFQITIRVNGRAIEAKRRGGSFLVTPLEGGEIFDLLASLLAFSSAGTRACGVMEWRLEA